LARFGFERDHAAAGYGAILDAVYDAVASELRQAAAALAEILAG
jgi:hypothetical protein